MKLFQRLTALFEAAVLLFGTAAMPVYAITEVVEGNIGHYMKSVEVFPDLPLTNNPQIEGLISVAQSQLGTTRDENGETKYGRFFDMPREAWCAFFVAWCANQAGIPTNIIAKMGVCDASWYAENGTLHYFFDASGSGTQKTKIRTYGIRVKNRADYVPQRGDLLYFKWDTSSGSQLFDHVGIVCGVVGDTLYTVEGNSGTGIVRYKVYDWKTETQIRAYATPNYTPTEPYRPGYYRVRSSSGLNLREDAGSSSALLLSFPNNTLLRVTQISENGKWGKTTASDGTVGWVNLSYTLRTADILAEKVVGPKTVFAEEGSVFPLGTSVFPSDATEQVLTLTPKDPDILSAAEMGTLVSANKPGRTYVTSRDVFGHTFVTEVNVVPRSPEREMSGWLTVLPDASPTAERLTEQGVFYRSHVYEEKTAYAPEEGYEIADTAMEYSDWGEETVTREKPEESDLLDLTKEEEVYVYFHYHNAYENDKKGIDSVPVGEDAEYEEIVLHAPLSTSDMSDRGEQQAYYDEESACEKGYHSWFLKESYTEYTYVTRTSQTVYTLVKESGWSEWSEEMPANAADGEEVEELPVMRYLDTELVSLRLLSAPSDTAVLARRQIDTTGLVLEGTYADGTVKKITEGFTLEGYDPETEGKQTISVLYLTRSVSFDITVTDPEPATLWAEAPEGVWRSEQTVALRVRNNHGLTSFTLKVDYDPAALSVGTPTSTEGTVSVTGSSNGSLSLTFKAEEPFTEDDAILFLPVTLLRTAPIGAQSVTLSASGAMRTADKPVRLEAETVSVKVVKEKEHSYSSSVTAEPTCAQEGVKTYVCDICDDTFTKPIAKLKHTYVSSVTRESTCTEKGEMAYVCSVCGDTYTEELPLLEHKYGESETEQPTCTKGGTLTFTCEGCGKTYTKPIPATGHNYGSSASQEATCAEEGWTEKTCEACGDVIRERIEKKPHTYKDTVVEPMGAAEGYTEHVCTVCGYSFRDQYEKPVAYPIVYLMDDGSEYCTEEQYRTETVRLPKEPEKKRDAQFTYAFAGWEGYEEHMTVTGEMTFRALFTETVNKYEVTFTDEDGLTYLSQTVPYGTAVPLPEKTPQREESAIYRYEFRGYEGYEEGMTVKGPTRIKVVFDVIRKYPERIVSPVFTVERDTKRIRRIPLGTTASAFLSTFGTDSAFLTLYNGSKEVTGDTILTTGMTLVLAGDGNTIETLTLILTADPSGDGAASLTDYVLLKSHLLQKDTMKGSTLAAADLNGDGEVTLADYVLLRSYLLKKGEITPV